MVARSEEYPAILVGGPLAGLLVRAGDDREWLEFPYAPALGVPDGDQAAPPGALLRGLPVYYHRYRRGPLAGGVRRFDHDPAASTAPEAPA